MSDIKRVIIESPYSGNVSENLAYARKCMTDCLSRGEAPFASHLLYTQVLDDTVEEQRIQGMVAGFAWTKRADIVVVYRDLGISGGMQSGIDVAKSFGLPVEYRTLKNKSP